MALDDYARLPDDAWERRFVSTLLLRVRDDLQRMTGDARYAAREEIDMRYAEIAKQVEQIIVDVESRAEARGEARGEANALRTVLASRGFAVDPATERLIASCADAPQLRQWIARAVTAPSLAAVFAP